MQCAVPLKLNLVCKKIAAKEKPLWRKRGKRAGEKDKEWPLILGNAVKETVCRGILWAITRGER